MSRHEGMRDGMRSLCSDTNVSRNLEAIAPKKVEIDQGLETRAESPDDVRLHSRRAVEERDLDFRDHSWRVVIGFMHNFTPSPSPLCTL